MTVDYGNQKKPRPFSVRQETSLLAGILILVTGGIKSLEMNFLSSPTYFDKSVWYFGSIVGGILVYILPYKLPCKFIYMFASILTCIGGIITSSTTNRDPYEAAAFINGVACGIALLLTINGAFSDSAHRGRIGALDSTAFTFGIFIYSVFTYIFANGKSFELSQALGIVTCVLSVLAFLASFIAIDSPITLLILSDECGSFQNVMDLNREECASFDTYNQFEDVKNFVIEDRGIPTWQRIGQGILPCIKISIIRTFFTFSTTYPVFLTAYSCMVLENLKLAIIVYGAAGFIGAALSKRFLLDLIGRKIILILSTLICEVLTIATGYFISSSDLVFKFSYIIILLVGLQLFAGFGQGVSSVYMTEAFPPHAKKLFIFLVLLLEKVAVVIAFQFGSLSQIDEKFFYGIAGGFLVSFLIALFMLPETKKMSLKDAKERFSKLCSLGCK